MRLRIGLPPEDDSFVEGGDWRLLREPGIWSLQCLGVGTGVLTVLILVGLLFLAYGKVVFQLSFLVVMALIIPVTPIHEMIHAALLPGSLLSRQTTLGLSLRVSGVYVFYPGELDRWRVLMVIAGPFVVLTLIPLVSMLAAGKWSPLLVEISLANGLGSQLDIINLFLIYGGIPDGARVRMSGMKTYWRLAT
jgi:hypothetical protein